MKPQSLFLLVTYLTRPTYPHMTASKKYWSGAGVARMDEQVGFARKVKNRDLSNCSVILDLVNKKIIKCVVGELTGSDYDRVYGYFKTNYTNYMEQAEKQIAGELPSEDTQIPVDAIPEAVTHAPKQHTDINQVFPMLNPAPQPAARRRAYSKGGARGQ